MMMSFALPRLRQLCSALANRRRSRYTGSEVRALLSRRASEATDRRRAVLATAAVPSSWTGYLRDDQAWQLGRVAGRLPTIVFWHRSGQSSEEIGRRIGVFGGSWLAERALEVAAACIAARLNDRGLPAARGAL